MSRIEARRAFLEILALCLSVLATTLEKHGGRWSFSLLLLSPTPSHEFPWLPSLPLLMGEVMVCSWLASSAVNLFLLWA